jgi:hypothetical protein
LAELLGSFIVSAPTMLNLSEEQLYCLFKAIGVPQLAALRNLLIFNQIIVLKSEGQYHFEGFSLQ